MVPGRLSVLPSRSGWRGVGSSSRVVGRGRVELAGEQRVDDCVDAPDGPGVAHQVLAGSMRPEGGVRSIGDFLEMESLTLNSPSRPTSAEEWAEIRSLSRLTDLSTTAVSLETLPSDAVVGGVSHLALSGGG